MRNGINNDDYKYPTDVTEKGPITPNPDEQPHYDKTLTKLHNYDNPNFGSAPSKVAADCLTTDEPLYDTVDVKRQDDE